MRLTLKMKYIRTCRCRIGIVIAMMGLVSLAPGCIGFKTGPVQTIVKGREPIKKECKLQTNNGITAKLTPDRGQMFMELWWWNKRAVTTTFRENKQDAILGTTRIGLFPGVGTPKYDYQSNVEGGGKKDPFTATFMNLFLLIPTLSSLMEEPFRDYAAAGKQVDRGDRIGGYGLIGTYKYLDSKNPKVLRSFCSEDQAQTVEEEPIRLTTFDVEIDGKVFHGENGVTHVGSIVGDKTALDVKVVSFAPPEGFATNDVSSVFGCSFKVKVPSEAELAAIAEKQRQAALAEEQARQDEAAAQDAAQREAALMLVNAAVQGINSTAAAASAPVQPRVATPTHTTVTPRTTTPTVKSTYQPKSIPKYTIVPRAPSFGLSNGTTTGGSRVGTGLQRVK